MTKELAAKRIQLAHERLAAARTLLSAHPSDAITRAYRAMSQAARAALAIEGISAHDDEDLYARFRLYHGRSGALDPSLLREYVEARGISHEVDEGDGADRSAEKAKRLVDAAGRLVEEVERVLAARSAESVARPVAAAITGELTPEKAAMLQELGAVFPGEPHLAKRYLATYGWGKVVAPNVRAIRAADAAAREASEGEGEPPAPEGEGTSPFYAATIQCGFCKGEPFATRLLRSKSLQIVFEYPSSSYPLFVPACGGTMRNYLPADPLLYEVHVCPYCFYASPTLGNFVTDDAYAQSKGLLQQLAARKIEHLRELLAVGREARVARAREAGIEPGAAAAKALGPERTPARARLALVLAADCGRSEAEYNGNAQLLSAKSLLGAARLARDAGDTTGERAHWEEALGLLESCFERTSRPGEALYLTGVLQHLVGRSQEARVNLTRVVGDRGKLPDAVKFKRFAENLREDLKRASSSE